jgi:hypothetical protein
MIAYPKVKFIEALDDYKLFVIFDNGTIKIYSIKEKLNEEAFTPLKDTNLFRKVHVASGGYGIIWNDEIDLSEYELWKNGTQVSSLQKIAEDCVS